MKKNISKDRGPDIILRTLEETRIMLEMTLDTTQWVPGFGLVPTAFWQSSLPATPDSEHGCWSRSSLTPDLLSANLFCDAFDNRL
jgi:hypothetical protein